MKLFNTVIAVLFSALMLSNAVYADCLPAYEKELTEREESLDSGLSFFPFNIFKRNKLNQFRAMYQILADQDTTYTRQTKKLIKKMTKRLEISEERLEERLKSLSLTEALCDGTVTGDTDKPLARPKHIWKYSF